MIDVTRQGKRTPFYSPWLAWGYPFLFCAIPFILYLILYSTHLLVVQELGVIVYYYSLTWLWIIPLFYFALKIKGRSGSFLNLLLLSLLFSLPLIAIWMRGGGGGFTIGGFTVGGYIPISDAIEYYTSAGRINLGYLLTEWGTRRPLFHAFLASLFFFAGKQWTNTLVLLSVLTIFSTYLSLNEIRKYLGPGAATLYVVVIFIFFRRFIGTTLSENLGFILGLLSTAVLFRGIFIKNKFLVALGTFLLTLGLMARTGAFFVLPFILVWGWFSFTKGEILKQKAGTTLLFLAAILAGFLINSLCINLLGSSNKELPFESFAASFYGLVFGGDWSLYLQNPALQGLASEKELWEKAYAIAFSAIRANPMLLVNGIFRAWKVFFLTGHPFIYFQNNSIQIVLTLFSGYSLLLLAFIRKNLGRFLLACAAGIVLSVPFVPPWDSGYMRTYAATIPLLAAIPAFGVYQTGEFLRRSREKDKQKWLSLDHPVEKASWRSPLLIFSMLIVFLSFPFPIILQRVVAARTANLAGAQMITAEADGSVKIQIDQPGNFLNIIPDSAPYSLVPNIRRQDFSENALPFLETKMADFLAANLHENESYGFDPILGKYIIIDTQLLQPKTGVYAVDLSNAPDFATIIIRAKTGDDKK